MWDEPKRLTNLRKRSLDFADLDGDFFIGAIIVSAKDNRYKAIGVFSGLPHTVIFKPLGRETISVISFRRADRKEGKLL